MPKQITFKAPVTTADGPKDPPDTTQITGTLCYLTIGNRRIRCVEHLDPVGATVVSHYASGLILLNYQRIQRARANFAHTGERATARKIRDKAVEQLVENVDVNMVHRTIDQAKVINGA